MRDWPRDGGFNRYPDRDGRGGRIDERRAERAPSRVIVDRTINNVTIVNNINVRVRGRYTPGGTYWYYDNGMRWSHHYDHNHVHWFGFYLGGIYFWTRWHNDRLWWHDHSHGRWLHYREGHWWYQDPFDPSVVWIYRDGAYYRYTPVRGGYETRPETPTAPSTPAEPEVKTEFYSEDGSRLVKILGDEKEAFLYDASGEEETFKAFLASGVEAVQFAGGTEESPLQVLLTVTLEDGTKSFKLFDAEGREFGQPEDEVQPDTQLSESPAFQSLGAPGWR